jgi:hypothetical protein
MKWCGTTHSVFFNLILLEEVATQSLITGSKGSITGWELMIKALAVSE